MISMAYKWARNVELTYADGCGDSCGYVCDYQVYFARVSDDGLAGVEQQVHRKKSRQDQMVSPVIDKHRPALEPEP